MMLQRVDIQTGWRFRQAGTSEWHPAAVPGCVHTDLYQNNLIDDPFYRDNETALQWIEEKEWEYETVFDYPAELLELENQVLVFHGLDSYADVYLNDTLILSADNMHRMYRVDCRHHLVTGPNTLRIILNSNALHDLEKAQSYQPLIPSVFDQENGTSVHARKAMYHYGWDWGPRFVTAGIWQPVQLECWEGARIDSVEIQQKIDNEQARLTFEFTIHSDVDRAAELKIHSDDDVFLEHRCQLEKGETIVVLPVNVENPKLWWPAGYGEQNLYTFTCELFLDDKVDCIEKRIGVRSIELRRHKDSFGESFEFVVNGVAIFAKGANWIPADSFPSRITKEHYRHLLDSAVQANMNMLRVWGGGIYEPDIFYDLCDELGILVWQDFMFSCALYPTDDAFLKNIEQEAIDQIKRLRHHPAIVLWCGNNEIELGWQHFGWKSTVPNSYFENNQTIFRELLPDLCKTYDAARPYWPSSPTSLHSDDTQSQREGDVHYWDVWHDKQPFEKYTEQYPRFMSEFGFQSFPLLPTVETFCEPEDYDIESPVMLLHQKNSRGNQLIREYMRRDYPEPKDFESFLYLSQILQAEAIKVGAEQFRRIRPVCMGSLYWQLNDCWPVASWSSIDYTGRWKALHYYARRFYAPVLVCAHTQDDDISIFVVSDRQDVFSVNLHVRLLDFKGREIKSIEREFFIPGPCSFADVVLKHSELIQKCSLHDAFLLLQAKEGENVIAENLYFFCKPAQQHLQEPLVLSTVEGNTLRLKSNTLARHVYVESESVTHFDDNFFDLIPGSTKDVHFNGELGEFTIKSLINAFES